MMGRKSWSTFAIAALLAAGCSPLGGDGGGGGGPAVTPSMAPPKEYLGEAKTPYPDGPSADGATLVDNVDFTKQDVPFASAVTAADIASGSFAAGSWSVDATKGTYSQTNPGPSTQLAIQKYTGTLGASYRVQVTGWTYRVFTGDPAQDQGVVVLMPYYRDNTHYVICSAGPQTAESWICDGQLPGSSWPTTNKLWGAQYGQARPVGTAFTWTADVDTNAHTMTLYLNGDKKATVTNAFIDGAGTVAVASNGDQVRYANFKVYSLSGSASSTTPSPAPTITPTPTRTPAPTSTVAPTPNATPAGPAAGDTTPAL